MLLMGDANMGSYYRIAVRAEMPKAKRVRAFKLHSHKSRLFRSADEARRFLSEMTQPELYIVEATGTYFVGKQRK